MIWLKKGFFKSSVQNTFMPELVNLRFNATIWREFRFLPVIGGSYGFYHSKGWAAVTVINYIMMYSVMLFTISLLFYTSYLLRDNIGFLSQAIHFIIVGFVAMTASINLSLNRYRMERFIFFFDDPWSLCEYSRNDYFDELVKKSVRKKNKLIVTWILIYGVNGMIGAFLPVIDTYFGRSMDLTNVNGAWLNLPLVLWWPEDITASKNAWLAAYFLEGLYMYFCAVMVTAAVVLCFSAIERLLDQLKLITHGINTLDERTKIMFRQKFPGLDMKYMEKEYDDCYYECLMKNVKHHNEMLVWLEEFKEISSLPIAVPFYGGAILLGMALITVTEEDDPRVGPKLLALSLAFAEAYNMFLLCDVGQRLQNLSQELYDAIYFCRWPRRSQRVKKGIQIMRFGCQKPLKLTAAKLLVLNMELFSDLVNSAYSIFNLKAASKARQGSCKDCE